MGQQVSSICAPRTAVVRIRKHIVTLSFQDGNGGIWLVDIKVAADAKRPKRLVKFHGDSITSLQTSPIGYFIATTSLDGWFHVYDVVGKKLIFAYNFKVPITSSVWLPFKVNIVVDRFSVFFLTFYTSPLPLIYHVQSRTNGDVHTFADDRLRKCFCHRVPDGYFKNGHGAPWADDRRRRATEVV